ncbi:hypothetical protein B9J78_04750 [bacterium Unc6]|nr:hypothetical protein [bacterium Unc6]
MEQNISHKFINGLKEGEFVDGIYVVREKQVPTTKKGDLYLTLVLSDKTGCIEARKWDITRNLADTINVADYVRITGVVGSYRKQLQLNISNFIRTESKNINPSLYIPTTDKDIEELWDKLISVIKQIKNPYIVKLFENLFRDEKMSVAFKTAPAAVEFHHAYLGGLLEHTVSMLNIAEVLIEFYPILDRDILIAGIVLHDIGKTEELAYDTTIYYTDSGKLIGHIILGATIAKGLIDRIENFPKSIENIILHLILSHHGEIEWGAPKRPQCTEAIAVHHIDNIDAKLAGFENILKKDKDPTSAWTEYSKMFDHQLYKGIYFLDNNEIGPEDK